MATVMAPQPHHHPTPSELAHNCIVSHIFANPGTYDPTGGAASRHADGQQVPPHLPKPKQAAIRASSQTLKAAHSESPSDERRDMSAFTAALLNQINQSNALPVSLPTTFILSFLQHCFHPDLTLVDFPQSLVALEYLEELDKRRKRVVAAGLARLGIGRATLHSDADSLAKNHPSFAAWVKDVEPGERKADALYTQLYVALRRWILLNEFCLAPFHKYNCIAMLNVLLPPPSTTSARAPPTPVLTSAVLHEQREMYIKHINAVEAKGINVLRNLMNQGKREYEITGWPAVRETLDKYLRITEKLINEAESIDDFGAFDDSAISANTKRKTADSGISIGSGNSTTKHTPCTSNNSNGNPSDTNKPLPSPPAGGDPNAAERGAPPTNTLKASSTLEKIAIELRKLKLRHKIHNPPNDTNEHARAQPPDAADPTAGSPLAPTSTPPNYSRLLGNGTASEHPEQSASQNPSKASEERTSSKQESNRSRGRSLSRSRSRSRSMSLGRLRRGKADKAEDEAEAFNRDEMLRQRAIWEARNSAERD